MPGFLWVVTLVITTGEGLKPQDTRWFMKKHTPKSYIALIIFDFKTTTWDLAFGFVSDSSGRVL
jgi:hypothetical protein